VLQYANKYKEDTKKYKNKHIKNQTKPQNNTGKFMEALGMFTTLTVVMIWAYAYVQFHQNVHIK